LQISALEGYPRDIWKKAAELIKQHTKVASAYVAVVTKPGEPDYAWPEADGDEGAAATAETDDEAEDNPPPPPAKEEGEEEPQEEGDNSSTVRLCCPSSRTSELACNLQKQLANEC
jgi:hypothetical protein